jgi:hypothetical protein
MITNAAGASISGGTSAVFITGAAGTLINTGMINATGAAGVDIEAGGSITNAVGASISGGAFGVFLTGGAGTITNAGTISGGSYAIDFAGSGANRLIIDPGAVFAGSVAGGSGTLELAAGTGAITGIDSGSFNNFAVLVVDAGGSWTLGGVDTAPSVLDNGTITVTGSLDASTAIDPSSTGLFNIGNGASLEVAAATGAQTQMSFVSNSRLVIDSAASFGINVGASSYSGPQLQDFTSGDTIDIKNFSVTGAALNYNAATGALQISNNAAQAASLAFQTSSLGSGVFHVASDGASGIFITHS